MTNLNRFSSRRERLDHAYLSARLKDAKSYKRIAGYFRSSIFELVGEEIAAIARCPFRIAIVSTGLIFHDSDGGNDHSQWGGGGFL